MKLENATNLEEPSLGMMMGLIHAKTIACTFLWKVMKISKYVHDDLEAHK